MNIRSFKTEEAKEVSDVIRQTIRISNTKDYPLDLMEELIAFETPEHVLERAGWTHLYVAEDEGKIIGCGAIGPYWGKTDESSLFTIFVLPEYQGKGVGRSLIDVLQKDEFYLRAKRVEIPASITGVPFYLKMGYDFKDGIDTPDDEHLIRMEKHKDLSIVRFVEDKDDRNEISRIYENSWKYAYKDIIPQEYLDSIPEGRWAGKIDTPSWKTLVCTDGDKLVGTSSFCDSRFENFAGYGEIISIYLLPEYQGRGYGKYILDRALSELKEAGYEKAFLWVLEDNLPARKFYEKNGFKLSSEVIDDNIGGKELREVSYTIDLC